MLLPVMHEGVPKMETFNTPPSTSFGFLSDKARTFADHLHARAVHAWGLEQEGVPLSQIKQAAMARTYGLSFLQD